MPARHRLLAAVPASLLATAALAGCGSDSTATTPTATPGAAPAVPQNGARPNLSDEQRAQVAELRDCLKKQGADLPEGGPAAGGPPQIDPAAIQACAQYLPQGMVPPGIVPPGGSS
jgi:hypothetical protein